MKNHLDVDFLKKLINACIEEDLCILANSNSHEAQAEMRGRVHAYRRVRDEFIQKSQNAL